MCQHLLAQCGTLRQIRRAHHQAPFAFPEPKAAMHEHPRLQNARCADILRLEVHVASNALCKALCCIPRVSQRSLHNAPIFRLLLKVAVNGTHQCDFPNFCGQQCPTLTLAIDARIALLRIKTRMPIEAAWRQQQNIFAYPNNWALENISFVTNNERLY